MDMATGPNCSECGHPTSAHYAVRMVDFPREQNGHCGDHTGCEICDLESARSNKQLTKSKEN